jgi:hypothetical protein
MIQKTLGSQADSCPPSQDILRSLCNQNPVVCAIALCFIHTDFLEALSASNIKVVVFTIFCQLTLQNKGFYWNFIL